MTTYYVDFTGGLDTNDGLTPATAWKTVTKVVAQMATYVPDDKILFKYGETFTGVQLTITCSGTNGHPITFGAYGNSADGLPVIDGNDTVECVQAVNRSRLRFENLYAYQGINSGFQFNTCSYIDVIDCEASDCGNDNLIFVTGCHHCLVDGGRFHDAYLRTGTFLISGIEIADDCHDIDLIGVECYDNGSTADNGHGITIHSHDGTGMPYNIRVLGAYCYGNNGSGVHIFKQDDTEDTNSNIFVGGGNSILNLNDGIRVHKGAGASNYPNGVTVSDFVVWSNTRYGFWMEGDNHLLERIVTNQRNYFNACTNCAIYKSVLYATFGAGLFSIFIQNARTNGVQVKDNIFYGTNSGWYPIGTNAGASTNVDIDYNSYQHPNAALNRWRWDGADGNYANWRTVVGQDANSPSAMQDPLFRNLANLVWTVKPNSPALNIGTEVNLWHRSGAPDCGLGYRPLKHKGYAFIE